MPEAAVPAPIAYVKVVALEKLAVGFRSGTVGPPQDVLLAGLLFIAKTACALGWVCSWVGVRSICDVYFTKQTIA